MGSYDLRVLASREAVNTAEVAAGVGDADGASDAAVDATGAAGAVRQAGAGALHELLPEAGVLTVRCCSRRGLMHNHGGDSASRAD